MNYKEAIDWIVAAIAAYNEHVDEKINAGDVVHKIKVAGGVSVDDLAAMEVDDFRAAGLPVAIARRAKATFGKAPAPQAQLPLRLETARDAAMAKATAALLAEFDPTNPGVVGEVLRERGGERAWLLYGTDDKVLARESADRLAALLAGDDVEELPVIDGEVVEPRRFGEPAKPKRRRLNPLYRGEYLVGATQRCKRTGLDYRPSAAEADPAKRDTSNDVTDEAQGLLLLAMQQGEISNDPDRQIAKIIIGDARGPDGAKRLRVEYRQAAVAYSRKAPTLDVEAEEAAHGAPFTADGDACTERPFGEPMTISVTPGGPWTHARKCALVNALVAAFPTKADLAQMVRFGLRENIEAIAEGGTLDHVANSLVFDWADPQGKMSELFAAARSRNPGNLALRLLSAEMTPKAAQFRRLSGKTLGEIHETAVKIGLSSYRAALMAEIDVAFVASLPTSSAPSVQMMTDINECNCTLRDGTAPIQQWLSNAIALSKSRSERSIFERALAESRKQ